MRWNLPGLHVVLNAVAIAAMGLIGASAPAQEPAAQPLSPQELQVLVTGVAFYPDAVIEQVLTAAQEPIALHQGAQQLAANPTNEADQLLRANLPESVRFLQQYPELLRQLDAQLPQTTRLGVAAKTQTQDVWHAIDAVRAQAQPATVPQGEEPTASTGDSGSSGGSTGGVYPVPVGVVHPGWLTPLIINEAREARAGQVNITANGQFSRQATIGTGQFGRPLE
ncbi:MAG: DUF3300 domain-containing protein, partial [Planctomycetes bacterium]|nr:DUF3300 domain-containing protein [Planctomycetota bacterium]